MYDENVSSESLPILHVIYAVLSCQASAREDRADSRDTARFAQAPSLTEVP